MSSPTSRRKLAYVPIPKNACTALKILFFFLRTDEEFVGHFDHVHTKFDYKASDFGRFAADKEFFKFTVVRDPLDRFVSAYNSRVKLYGELSERWFLGNRHKPEQIHAKFAARSLKFDPDINEFARRIDDYLTVSIRIQHHFVPQAYFFHGRPEVFDRIYNIGQLDQLLADLESKVGKTLSLRNVQETSGLENMARKSDLGTDEKNLLLDFYRNDYELLEPYL